tara:strand:+ start:10270 stop:11742 length:1473 start_codon:yes stop_codon:yes gene_type:complete
MIKKQNYLKLFLNSILIMGLSACAFTSETALDNNNNLYPEKLTEISIQGSFNKAIIAVNISTDYSNTNDTENFGNTPVSNLQNIHTLITPVDPVPFLEPNLPTTPLITTNKSPNKHTNQPLKSLNYLTEDPETTTFYDPALPGNIAATKVVSNNNCVIYVDSNSWTTYENDVNFNTYLNNAITYFTNTIQTNATNNLSEIDYNTDVDNNGKMILFITSMTNHSSANENTAGYFWAINLYDTNQQNCNDCINSNEKEILYINIEKIINNDYQHVIAHEFTHYLGAAARLIKGSGVNYDVWIEEGIAEGLTPYLSNDPDILINSFARLNEVKNGTGFLKQTNADSWYTYALSYTFFDYCRIQMDQEADFYKNLIEKSTNTTTKTNYKVLDNIIKTYNPNEDTDLIVNFEDALISYKIANHVKHSSNKYGYKNNTFQTSNLPSPLASPTNTGIETSGAIYFIQGDTYTEDTIDDFVPGTSGDNIKFFRIIPTE